MDLGTLPHITHIIAHVITHIITHTIISAPKEIEYLFGIVVVPITPIAEAAHHYTTTSLHYHITAPFITSSHHLHREGGQYDMLRAVKQFCYFPPILSL